MNLAIKPLILILVLIFKLKTRVGLEPTLINLQFITLPIMLSSLKFDIKLSWT
jgi:hypothetical protein